MALIATPIGPQSFEIIRDRIAEILEDEIASQVALNYDNAKANPVVYCERFIPFNDTDLPALNVTLARGDFDNIKQLVLDGTYLFNIDAYTYCNGSPENKGDTLAAKYLHRILGLARAIISNDKYKTLGFGTNPAFISNVKVSELGIADPAKMDLQNTIMGRIVVAVRCTELSPGAIPTLLAGHTSKIEFLNGSGYKYDL